MLRAMIFATLTALAGVFAGTTPAFAQSAGGPPGHGQSEHGEHAAMPASADAANPGDIRVDFELLDRDGRVVTDEDFRGRYLLLAFGFTHCTHVCPMMGFNMGNVLRATDKDAAGVFISVDTERDTPRISDDYASNFHEAMIGLGGSYEQINTVAKNFRVSYAVTKTQQSYTVQHTSSIYVIDPEGELIDSFAFTTPVESIVGAMQ